MTYLVTNLLDKVVKEMAACWANATQVLMPKGLKMQPATVHSTVSFQTWAVPCS